VKNLLAILAIAIPLVIGGTAATIGWWVNDHVHDAQVDWNQKQTDKKAEDQGRQIAALQDENEKLRQRIEDVARWTAQQLDRKRNK
jgi:hypothetical protein